LKIYLAASEQQMTGGRFVPKPEYNLFLTYFYKNSAVKALEILKPKGHKGLITIDSGAHSFFVITTGSVGVYKSTKEKTPNPDVYFEEYLLWAKKWYNHFDYFVELDIQDIVGTDKIWYWRKRMRDAGISKKMITVHHKMNTEAEFDRMLAESDSGYIGIEGVRDRKNLLPYNRWLKKAYEKKIKVHGFAFTAYKLLYKYPFYSVDSSSWTMGTRFGQLLHWNNGMMHTISSKDSFIKHNVNVNITRNNRSKAGGIEKLNFSAASFYKMQDYFTRYWESNGIKWKD